MPKSRYTEAQIVRALRRNPTTASNYVGLAEVSPVFVEADTERIFKHWAVLLPERLDAFKGM